ncbi:MAG TPA: type IV toxin-antitoxin system AbiEi family antitoxin domain-containing protein [Acidimicrobiales bacterium]|nr:type IV toxin-antitoxin system AbiEi family antitoxin domain-containing protein [Acidimicrobiales bacterium]
MRQLYDLASGQRSLFTYAQARELGLSQRTLYDWVVGGRVEQVHSGVYALAGSAPSWERDLLAAVLAGRAGCVGSHRSATRVWELGSFAEIDVSVPRSRLPRLTGVQVHRSLDLVAGDCTVRHGIPVTNPLRTLLDLGAVVPVWCVRDAVDAGVSKGLVTTAALDATLHRLAKRGRDGCGALREVLDGWALGSMRGTPLEARMARLCRRSGLPVPVFQHEVRTRTGRRMFIDFAFPDLMLAIEVDGHATHSTPRQLQSDLTRQNDLVGLGWTVLRFTWGDVTHRPDYVAATILRHLGTQAAPFRFPRA